MTSYLLVLRGHVILPLGLNDALAQVLNPRPLLSRPAQVNQTVNLELGLAGPGQTSQQFLDDVELSSQILVVLLASLVQRELELLFDQILRRVLNKSQYVRGEGRGGMVYRGNKSHLCHLPELRADLNLLHLAGDDHPCNVRDSKLG